MGILGVVKSIYGKPYVIGDMPGLIEGAHKGVGLGYKFLKHIERAKILAHFVDSSEEVSMIERYNMLRRELELYEENKPLSPYHDNEFFNVTKKMEMVVATKIETAHKNTLEEFETYLKGKSIKLYKISSLTKDGLNQFLEDMQINIDKIDIIIEENTAEKS